MLKFNLIKFLSPCHESSVAAVMEVVRVEKSVEGKQDSVCYLNAKAGVEAAHLSCGRAAERSHGSGTLQILTFHKSLG